MFKGITKWAVGWCKGLKAYIVNGIFNKNMIKCSCYNFFTNEK